MATTMRTVRLALALLALALGVLAARPAGAATNYWYDFGSRAAFVQDCRANGGQFHETEEGNLWCFYPNGGMVLCDANGNNCDWLGPPRTRPRGTHAPVGGGVVGAAGDRR
jgi:hypothetical protein